jgi:hypothetical protein
VYKVYTRRDRRSFICHPAGGAYSQDPEVDRPGC